MILRGIIDRSLGSITCIRGFAQMIDLERISEPNQNYQRDIIATHKKDIKDYLNKREYLFFPEVILSYTLNDLLDNIKLSALPDEAINVSSKRNKKVAFSKSITKYRGILDSRNQDKIEIVSIEIDEALINEGKKLFHRIDGNHRLTAASEINDITTQRMSTPFCLILLRNDVADEKFESVVFHNINSKGEHLTSEENLKGIFNEDYFSDEELGKNFSWSYVKARQLTKKIDFTYLESIRNSFSDAINPNVLHLRTVAVKAIDFLKQERLITKGVSISKVLEQFSRINAIFSQEPNLKASNDDGLLICFLYYTFKNPDSNTHLEAFKNWVVSNRIFKVQVTDPLSIIEIFDKILEKEIKVFMAMPYYNDGEVDKYNAILDAAINTVKVNNEHLNLTMFPIMREKGASMDIVHNILNNIKNCEIFIADITKNNENVFFEYGYAHSLSKKVILLKKTEDKTKVPLDVSHNLRLKYKGHRELEKLLVERISQTIVQLGYVLNS